MERADVENGPRPGGEPLAGQATEQRGGGQDAGGRHRQAGEERGPSTTTTATPSRRSGFHVIATPSKAATTTTTTACARERMPAANALPVTSAARGVGVTRSFVRIPASRSQMIWMP